MSNKSACHEKVYNILSAICKTANCACLMSVFVLWINSH